MFEPKLISPLLDDFVVGSAMSEHDGVRCYPAMKNNSDTKYILKIISIPASSVQTDALLLTGAYKTVEEATAYFAQLAKDTENELHILDRLAKLEGFLTYEGCQVIENPTTGGFDVYLLGLYKRSLERHFRKMPMTHLAAVNLGLDICASLTVCRQAGYLYADLKPGNIFITEDNEYRIGDLGFLPIIGLKYASLPDRYRSSYTAPELSDPFAPISSTMDIYAAGLVLYQAYNGGELPFTGDAPGETLQPPLYADYEMSEIILKACAPDPADRWEDPIKMGQALVGYMQRNTVNDEPIIPPSAQIEEEAPQEPEPFEEEPTEEPEVLFEQADEAGQMMIETMIEFESADADEAAVEEPTEAPSDPEEELDELTNLSFLETLTSDETAPQEEMADEIVYEELTDDVSDMLEQADDLIAHELPAPPVAPEPTPLPEPDLPSEPESLEAEDAQEVDASADEETADAIEETCTDESAPAETLDHVDETVAAITEALGEQEEAEPVVEPEIELPIDLTAQEEPEDPYGPYDAEKPKKNLVNKILAGLLILIIVACLAVAGFLFYREYYIKVIDEMQVKGVDNQLTVSISTKADHELLKVVCTDTYGNRITAPVKNGYAAFSDLTPDSLYTITVEVEGFHGIKGDIRTTYTTAPQTEVVSFNSVTGAEAGSVILNFTIKGHDFAQWQVAYSTEGEQTQTTEFSGHMATISGLTVGKTYTFTLDAVGSGYVVGQYQLEYTATELIYPSDLDVKVFDQTGLKVTWSDPDGMDVTQWTALCYNDSGYSQNVSTAENTAQFTGIDPSASYTVEVTAAGMSVGSRFYISQNAVTISDLKAEMLNGGLNISWQHSGNVPASDWVLTYTIDDGTVETAVASNGNFGRIDAAVPGAVYKLKLKLQDGTTVINGMHSIEIPAAQPFSGYGISTDAMVWRMCLAPNAYDWIWWDVGSYQDSFRAGQNAGFVVRLTNRYGISDDLINIVYVIRDSEGNVVSANSVAQTWTSMWYQFYGEFNVPYLPQEPGQYTMEIYLAGAFAHKQEFTIKE